MTTDFSMIILPLTEKNMNSAKDGEIVVDTKKGHITIKKGENYISKTKELEARVNALSDLKNDLTDQYLNLEEDIDYLISEYKRIKTDTKSTRNEADTLTNELDELQILLQSYLSKIDVYCQKITEFQYTSVRPYINLVVDNLRNLVKLKATIDELSFLAKELTEQKNSNYYAISSLTS